MTNAITVDDLRRQLNLEFGEGDAILLHDKIAVATAEVESYMGAPNGAAHASGTITFGAPLIAGDTITLDGVPFQAIAVGPASPGQFVIGTTPQATAANLLQAIIAFQDNPALFPVDSYSTRVISAHYAIAGEVLSIIAPDIGTEGNSYTLATTSAHVTLSGPTLTGGAYPPAPVAEAVRQLASHLFENREASIVGISARELPFGFLDLIGPYRKWVF
jgi:hypothetical protein